MDSLNVKKTRVVETHKVFGPSPQQLTLVLKDVTVAATDAMRPNRASEGDQGEGLGEQARLLRHFTVLYKGAPGTADLVTIAEVLISQHLRRNQGFPRSLKDMASPLAKAIAAVHMEVGRLLRRSPARPQLAWNLKHIERILDGGLVSTFES